MGDIYHSAEEVAMWFGPADALFQKGLQCMEELLSTQRSISSREWNKITVAEYNKLKTKLGGERWGLLSAIFEHEYWTRLWTLQEFLLAKKYHPLR
jgi:hypothetical protein